jgi:hypothetical protein
VPLEAWALAGVAYVALVAVARAAAPVRSALGFARTIPESAIDSDAVIDVASESEGPTIPATRPVPA